MVCECYRVVKDETDRLLSTAKQGWPHALEAVK